MLCLGCVKLSFLREQSCGVSFGRLIRSSRAARWPPSSRSPALSPRTPRVSATQHSVSRWGGTMPSTMPFQRRETSPQRRCVPAFSSRSPSLVKEAVLTPRLSRQVLIGYWTPKYNWLPSLFLLFFVVAVNLIHVRAYGEVRPSLFLVLPWHELTVSRTLRAARVLAFAAQDYRHRHLLLPRHRRYALFDLLKPQTFSNSALLRAVNAGGNVDGEYSTSSSSVSRRTEPARR